MINQDLIKPPGLNYYNTYLFLILRFFGHLKLQNKNIIAREIINIYINKKKLNPRQNLN